MNYGSKIVGTGSAFPEKVMTNADFEAFLDTSDEWIKSRTGIETRRIADPKKGESTLSISIDASKNALEMAGIKADELDLIIVGTVTPDTLMPSTGVQIQRALGAKKAFCFDLQAACSGFLYGLSIADQYMRTGGIKNALIIGAETLSTILNWQDRSTCVLFGDGAGAAVLTRTEDEHRVIGTRLFSDGNYGDILCIPHGYSKVPPESAEYKRSLHKVHMKGKEIYKLDVRSMVDSANQILDENKVAASEVNLFIFHQANIRIIDTCAKALGVDRSKLWINVQKYGNTSAATLPVCLDEAVRSKSVKSGDLVLMATFGGGVTWGSGLIRL